MLPIQLPMQPINMSRRRTSRIIPRSDIIAAATTATVDIDTLKDHTNTNTLGGSGTISAAAASAPSSGAGSSESGKSSNNNMNASPLTWLSRIILKAEKNERLHYHSNGHHHHHHHHHHHGHRRTLSSSQPLIKQLFTKATVVTLEQKYATVQWAGTSMIITRYPSFPLHHILFPPHFWQCQSHENSFYSQGFLTFRWNDPTSPSTHSQENNSTPEFATNIFQLQRDFCFPAVSIVCALIAVTISLPYIPT